MGFRRFWARRESCVVQKTPIRVGSTSPVFAPYWSSKPTRRLLGPTLHPKGHLPKTVGYTYGFMLYWAKNRKNTQRIGRTHVTIASQEGNFLRTSRSPQTPMASQVLRAGAQPWVSCMRSEICYFMPRSHEAPGQSAGPVRAKPV